MNYLVTGSLKYEYANTGGLSQVVRIIYSYYDLEVACNPTAVVILIRAFNVILADGQWCTQKVSIV
jgi:hypothetical protein